MQTVGVLMHRREVLLGGLAAVLSIAAGCSKRGSTSSAPARGLNAGNNFLAHIGDSISVASQEALTTMLTAAGFKDPIVNAQVGRRIEVPGGLLGTTAGAEIVGYLAASPTPPTVWIIALGTNDLGQYPDDAAYQTVVEKMLARFATDAPLVWVNTYAADRLPDTERFNQVLQTVVTARGNAVIGDWYQQCAKTQGGILSDGIHPNDIGVVAFVDTIKAALTELLT